MAIREFGQSLLGNVRERKDQQAQDARDYAKKQGRKELLLTGGAILGGQLYKATTANIETKTNAFLANSELNQRKADLQRAEQAAVEANKHFKASEDAGFSMYDLSLRNSADSAVAAKKLKDPNSIKPNEEGDWRAMFMERDIHKQNALSESSYFEEVIKRGKEIELGKTNYSLDSLASVQRPKTIIGSMWNKYTDQETSVDVFNSRMSKLKQVVAADTINALTFDRRAESASKIVADGGDPSLVNALVGAPTTKEEKARIERTLEQGETRKEEAQALVSNSAGVFSRKIITYTAVNKEETRVEVEDTKIVDGKGIITQSDVASAIHNLPTLYKMVKSNYNDAGQKLFQKETDKLMKDQKLTPEIINNLWAKAMQPETWEGYDPKMNVGELDPKVMAAFVTTWSEVTANLESEIASNAGFSDPARIEKVVAATNQVLALQVATQEAISTRDLSAGDITGAIKSGGVIPEGTVHVMANGSRYISNGKGGWILDD